MTIVLSMVAMLLVGFVFGIFLSRSSRRSERETMLERRVRMLLLENAELQRQVDTAEAPLVDVLEVLPAAPTTIRWREWVRTISDEIPEWERWDETDSWYLTVCLHDDGLWGWYAAFAPNAAENAVSRGGVTSTMVGARQFARDWAQTHAANPAALKALALEQAEGTKTGQVATEGGGTHGD